MKSFEEFEAYLGSEEAKADLEAFMKEAGENLEALKTRILEYAQEKGFELDADQLECLSGLELEDDALSDAAGGRSRTGIPWMRRSNDNQNRVACGPEKDRVLIII